MENSLLIVKTHLRVKCIKIKGIKKKHTKKKILATIFSLHFLT